LEVSSFPKFVDNELTYFQPEPDSDNECEVMVGPNLAVAEAQEWINETYTDEAASPGILSIVNDLLKDAERFKTHWAIKDLMPLTAIMHFVKMCERY